MQNKKNIVSDANNFRMEILGETLNEAKINITKLQKLCFGGINESSKLRPTCWKLLLDYLPADKSKWKSFLQAQRNSYIELTKEFIVNNSRCSENATDDPLTNSESTEWNEYFNDNCIISQITSDSIRTCPGISFFVSESKTPLSTILNDSSVNGILRKRINPTVYSEVCTLCNFENDKEFNWESIARILFIFTKVNPRLGYVQGMNELLAPIFYIFSRDIDSNNSFYAECDAFYCFARLMGEVCESFITDFDHDKNTGSGKLMYGFMNKLEIFSPDIYENLTTKGVKPEFFTFRWLTLLFSQEFQLPDVILIWDTLLSDPNRFEFMYIFGIAMLKLIKNEIFFGDFSAILKLLLNYPSHKYGVDIILKVAIEMYTPAWELNST